MTSSEEQYPYISAWVRDGRVEIGYGDYDDVFLRVMDPGGVVWESNRSYDSLDEALADMDAGIAAWCAENGIELLPRTDGPDEATTTISRSGDDRTVINQGEMYWIQAEEADRSELGYYPHPYVVVQDDVLNHSRIKTVVVCALTSNLKQAGWPGNVLLEVDEANLPRQSVVVVSKVSTVDKDQLGGYIGRLAEQRVKQILAGMRFLQTSFFSR